MLKAYFDESGIHASAKVCLVAGIIADLRVCTNLAASWRNLLVRYQVPYFHAKEYAQRTGPFRPKEVKRIGTFGLTHREYLWDDKKRFEFETDAISVINESLWIQIVGCAVNQRDFFAFSLDERRWLTGGFLSNTGKWKKQGAPTKPYFLAFRQTIMDAVKFTQRVDVGGVPQGTGDIVHFVFDQQREYESSACAIFNNMKRAESSVKDRIGDIIFTSKTQALPLQVADFIAYEWYRNIEEALVQGSHQFRNQAAKRLFQREKRLVYMNGSILKAMLERSPVRHNGAFVLPDPVDTRRQNGTPGPGYRLGMF
jgi:hypothetical protein